MWRKSEQLGTSKAEQFNILRQICPRIQSLSGKRSAQRKAFLFGSNGEVDRDIAEICDNILGRVKIERKNEYKDLLEGSADRCYMILKQKGLTKGGRKEIKEKIIYSLIHLLSMGFDPSDSSQEERHMKIDPELFLAIEQTWTKNEQSLAEYGLRHLLSKLLPSDLAISNLLYDRQANKMELISECIDQEKLIKLLHPECSIANCGFFLEDYKDTSCEVSDCEKRNCKLWEFTHRERNIFGRLIENHLGEIQDRRKIDSSFFFYSLFSLKQAEAELGMKVLKPNSEIIDIVGIPERSFYRRLKELKSFFISKKV